MPETLAVETRMGELLDAKAIEQGCYFDEAAAEHVVTFFEKYLCHSTGRWAGKPFLLEPWQKALLRRLFGWKNSDATRRFRKAYVEIPKKNGKSTLSGGIALYLLCADGEAAAQVFSAASDREQAGIVFAESAKMARASKYLRPRLSIVDSRKTIVFEKMGSFFRALSADAYTKEGLNIHGLIFDELHAQANRELWDALVYGGASRLQPMIVSITTAGHDRHSICYEQHDYARKVEQGIIEDITFLPCIFAADESDDWTSPATWAKANPSLGVTIDRRAFEADFREAREMPTKENAFKRYRLNIWTEQDVRWLPMQKWDACKGAVEIKSGTPCFGGLDLASTTDTCSFALYFPSVHAVLCWFWIPEEGAYERERKDRVPYSTWIQQGFIKATPGNVTDYDVIRKDINALRDEYNIRDIGIDRWNSTQLMTQLQGDGFTMTPFGQGFRDMNAPAKELERLVAAALLRHGGNPVLRWQASNAAAEMDPAGNVKPSKAKSRDRIDGVVATCMGIGRAIGPAAEESEQFQGDGKLLVLGGGA